MAEDLKDTLNLPRTGFPMKGNLVEREPARVKHWADNGLYTKIREKNRGGPRFILHDGPPFTNGDLHLGHALNKTLKDTILRFKWMRGCDAPYVPGWDSHGLPIEHKVSRELRESGRTDFTPLEVREACASFADRFRRIQRDQFVRLGVLADWENEYWTIAPEYEASELRTFARFVEAGLVYRSKKPVYWSIPCATALAEAEIEYRDHRSPSIYVRFPLTAESAGRLGLDGPASILIWTTTPWTLPANLAIAVHPEVDYLALNLDGENVLVAESLADTVVEACGLQADRGEQRWKGRQLEHLEARHPFIDRASPVVLANYVTTESGTGCVHTAPGHGLEDYQTGRQYGLEVYCPLDDEGCYLDDGRIPAGLAGVSVLETGGKSPANVAVLELLEATGALLKLNFVEHAYPHCWRSKTPVVFRAMDQWFVGLDSAGTRADALKALDGVTFIPDWGRNRLRAAVENRPDWCISRQRSWGVPIPAFYDDDGRAYLDAGVIRALADKVAREGTNLWFREDAASLLDGIELPVGWPAPDKLRPGSDTLDVWIDSGCSHRAVLRERPGLDWPADLYLEGSDQHRGWFQSSLLTGVIADGAAPFKSILTHGFIVKEDGTKLSKSDGAARPLTEWIGAYGADIVRLWICSQDYRGDVPVSDGIVRNVANSYRGIRNTLRFQIGNLADFDPARDAVAPDRMHPLDQWALNELHELVREVTEACEGYEFHRAFKEFIDPFCATTLSATYHAILKDRLYTLAVDDPLRRSSQTAIHTIFSAFTRLLAPLIPFTADEAWNFAHGDSDFGGQPVALADWPEADEAWRFPAVAGEIRTLRRFLAEHLNDPLERLRQEKVIGQSLDAAAVISGPADDPLFDLLKRYEPDLPELFILSGVTVTEDPAAESVSATVAHAPGIRCPRTWRWVPELVETEEWGPVSPRCRDALERRRAQAS